MLYLFARLQMVLTALLAGASTRRMSQARAITFIEYAILAAIAVGLGFLFRQELGSLFNNLFDKLGGAVSNGTETRT